MPVYANNVHVLFVNVFTVATYGVTYHKHTRLSSILFR